MICRDKEISGLMKRPCLIQSVEESTLTSHILYTWKLIVGLSVSGFLVYLVRGTYIRMYVHSLVILLVA